MRYSPWLTATFVIGLNSGFWPAAANTPSEAKPDRPDSTFLSDVLWTNPCSTTNLNRLADQMIQRLNDDNDAAVSGVSNLNLPFVDRWLDEDGNLNLPMGLTIYDAMGTTSIGFGSKF